MLAREVANSFSYYREKLDGKGVRSVLVRSISTPFEEIAAKLAGLGCQAEPIDAARAIELGEGVQLDAAQAQRLAPAIGAVKRG